MLKNLKKKKKKIIGGGGVDSLLSTCNNNNLNGNNGLQNKDLCCNNQSFQNDLLNTQKTNCQNENIINENEERINNLCLYCGQNKIKNKKGKTHELLTVDFARFNRANNGDKMNTQINKDNFEQRKNCNTQNSYNSNKVSLSSKGRINTTYQKRYNIVQSTVILLSWLFVFLLSAMIVYFTNVNNNNLINLQNNVVAEGVNTFADESTRVGKGTSESPYQISTMADLEFLSKNSSYWSASFLQTKDIPYTSSTWSPIGNYTTAFTGNYDGGGHNITFTQHVSPYDEGGVFSYVQGASSTDKVLIKNLFVDWSRLHVQAPAGGAATVGGIIAYAQCSSLSNCGVKGSISGSVSDEPSFGSLDLCLGGLIGNAGNGVSISNCYNESNIYAYEGLKRNECSNYAGGIVGLGNSTISNCYNTGDVTIEQSTYNTNVGGIIGYASSGSVENCYNVGTLSVTGSSTIKKWGIANITVNDCFYSNDCGGSGNGTATSSENLKKIETFTTNGANWEFDTVWAIDKTGVINNGYPYLQVFYPPQTAVVSFNVNTNVSAILNITDENGENSQQIFITPETAQSIELELSLKNYVVVISTYYTTNISFADSNGQATTTAPSGQTLTKNILTFTASQDLIIRLNLNGFVGNNGIVI